MPRRTEWARRVGPGGAATSAIGANWDLRLAGRVLSAVLATTLLACALLSGSASARVLGQPAQFAAFAETPKAPLVTKQPVSKTVEEGQSATFESTASGVPAPTVQWELSTDGGTTWGPVSGATSTSLTIPGALTAESGSQFRAAFTNSVGKATSKAATLTVQRAPAVTMQPVGTTVEEGQNAIFEASASGFPTPTVQWQVSSDGGTTWANVAGATASKLTVAATKTTFNGRLYRATFKNAAATATSESATLTVQKKPTVTKQPVSLTVNEGQNATFEATASGFPTPTVQWEVSTDAGATWSAVEGATTAQLTIAGTKTAESGNEYRAVFTNAAASATSTAATLTVDAPPVVTTQPSSQTVEEGQGVTFEAAASGVPTPTMQWELSTNGGSTWSAVSGATSGQLTIVSAKTSESARQYRATFKNVAGKATSSAATLTVHRAPALTKQPASLTVDEGQSATFEATASGFPTPTVQWEVSTDAGATWGAVEGATTTQLTIASTNGSESGNEYRAVFKNAAGEATSAPATLTVHSLPVVTTQPSSQTVEEGTTVTFEAAASGFPTPTVQWELSTNGGATWSSIEGATTGQVTIASANKAESANQYRATFKNASGEAKSQVATLTVAIHYHAFSWGQNLYRQLGDGTAKASSNVPVMVSGLNFVASVAGGGRHSLALLANGTAVSWGSDEFGQLGNGSTLASYVPVPVSGLSGAKAIAAGAFHSLALLSNGTVMAWGDNESGQLGIGSTKESEVPMPIPGLSGVKAISAGADFSLALLNNGTVMAWGDNENGQLGTGNLKSSTVPVPTKALTGVTAISAGGNFSLALLGKGTVEAWGNDESGELGKGPPEEGFSDVHGPVPGLTGVTAIAAGTDHALALEGSGPVMAWGNDRSGQLGNGTIKPLEETPVAVSGLSSGVSAISAGGHDSAALLSSGSLMAWGNNEWGTLGDGTSGVPSAVPVAVAGITKVTNVSVGTFHMLAFGEPLPTITSVSPNRGTAAGGTSITLTGDNFTGATAVKLGGVEATSFTVISDTEIEAVTPAGTGTVDITVTSPSGSSPTIPVDRFSYQHPPTVTKLSAKSGPTGGGTSVTITGTEFTGATKVSFGATDAASFTVKSSTSITAVSPARGAGTVHITVTNAAGVSASTTKDQFKYTPIVEAVAPNTGPTSGGVSVTVTGTGFALGSGATTFKFGTAKATSVACASSTSCTMHAPAGAIGTVNVTALVNKALSPISPSDQFTYG
jgi:alpha-tubulin suppressor-like RCC1 family protein